MEKKNVIYWVGVKNNLYSEKYGNFEYFEYSKSTWQYWCKKNNVEFIEYDTTSYDTNDHKVTWTRWFELELMLKDIDWDKVAVIDASYMIKWNAPNFFDMCSNKLNVFQSLENLRWIQSGIDGYRSMFNDMEFDIKRYIDCGFQIFSKSHLPFLSDLKKYYFDNYDMICQLEKDVKKGTDQPVYNYMLQQNNIDFEFSLDPSFNINHMTRFGWLGHNWQLNDKTPYFIKYGNIWKFSGFDRKMRNQLMSQTWDMIKENYI